MAEEEVLGDGEGRPRVYSENATATAYIDEDNVVDNVVGEPNPKA